MFPQQNTVADYHNWIWSQPASEHRYSDYPSWPNPDQAFSGLAGVGDTATDDTYMISPVVRAAYSIFSTAAAVSGAYHGYKRNDSVGWAVGWFMFGGLLPFLSVPIMFAEGFAERKH